MSSIVNYDKSREPWQGNPMQTLTTTGIWRLVGGLMSFNQPILLSQLYVFLVRPIELRAAVIEEMVAGGHPLVPRS